jgi:replicative DNA helicase
MLTDNSVYWKAALLPADFADGKSRAIYEAIRKLIEEGREANIVTVSTAASGLVPVGDIAALTTAASEASWRSVVPELKSEALRAKLASVQRHMGEWIKTEDPVNVLHMLENELTELTVGHASNLEIKPRAKDFMADLERRYRQRGRIPGVTTGMIALDECILGLERGKFYIFGARPSQGKSALLMNMALDAAKDGHRVGLITIESGAIEVFRRMVAREAQIDTAVLAKGRLKAEAFKSISDIVGRIYELPIFVADEPNMDLATLTMRARQMVQIHGVEVVYVDYIQNVSQTDYRLRTHEHYAEVSKSLKQISRTLNIPVAGAAQLKRDAEGRRPFLSDLSETGQIERDADAVVFIHHAKDAHDPSDYELIVEKARDSKTGVIPVTFDKAHMTFRAREVL